MMHATTQPSNMYDVASVSFFPIIDLSSSDENCIYSTLLFVIDEAKRSNIPVPCITFDQPLWQKALGIIKVKQLNIVCRLGGFHTLMSFLGSIGNLMKGSDLEELFEEVYSDRGYRKAHFFWSHRVKGSQGLSFGSKFFSKPHYLHAVGGKQTRNRQSRSILSKGNQSRS